MLPRLPRADSLDRTLLNLVGFREFSVALSDRVKLSDVRDLPLLDSCASIALAPWATAAQTAFPLGVAHVVGVSTEIQMVRGINARSNVAVMQDKKAWRNFTLRHGIGDAMSIIGFAIFGTDLTVTITAMAERPNDTLVWGCGCNEFAKLCKLRFPLDVNLCHAAILQSLLCKGKRF